MYRYVFMFLFRCTVLYLCFYFHVPLCIYVFISMYRYVFMFLFPCTVMYLCFYFHVPLCIYVFISMYRYVFMFLFPCTVMYLCFYFDVPLCIYVFISMYRYVLYTRYVFMFLFLVTIINNTIQYKKYECLNSKPIMCIYNRILMTNSRCSYITSYLPYVLIIWLFFV